MSGVALPSLPSFVAICQDVAILVRSIGDLHHLEMGGLFGVGGAVPLEGLHVAGMVHRHLWAGDLSSQQLDRLSVSAGVSHNLFRRCSTAASMV